jgi:broad specificity phosphatase PhoE
VNSAGRIFTSAKPPAADTSRLAMVAAATLRLAVRRARLAAAAGTGAALSGAAVVACDTQQTTGRWAWQKLLGTAAGDAAAPSMVVTSLPADLDYCNDGDALVAASRGTSAKVVWHVRHGESEGNVAKHKAQALDKAAGGGKEFFEEYLKDPQHVDAPLSPEGVAQAKRAAEAVALWKNTPTLIVASPMTRALQTASIVFQAQLEAGTAQLVIRPELREFFSRMQESRGRPIAELQACPRLRDFAPLQAALKEAQQEKWAEEWDQTLAAGAGYYSHVESPTRIEEFRVWLAERPERRIATVSHWGTINNLLNREPWADADSETRDGNLNGKQRPAWPVGGLARVFEMPNAGWVAATYTPR